MGGKPGYITYAVGFGRANTVGNGELEKKKGRGYCSFRRTATHSKIYILFKEAHPMRILILYIIPSRC